MDRLAIFYHYGIVCLSVSNYAQLSNFPFRPTTILQNSQSFRSTKSAMKTFDVGFWPCLNCPGTCALIQSNKPLRTFSAQARRRDMKNLWKTTRSIYEFWLDENVKFLHYLGTIKSTGGVTTHCVTNPHSGIRFSSDRSRYFCSFVILIWLGHGVGQ